MSIRPRTELVLALLAALAGCGESETAKRIGAQPKQTLDKAASGVNQALQQGADRSREAEEKK